MSTIFIGYEVSKGDFTNPKTGEIVAYNNRKLRAMTNDGEDKSNFGYSAFEEKVKLLDLAAWLGVPADDQKVDSVLNDLITKAVEFKRAPRNGEFTVVGFKAAK